MGSLSASIVIPCSGRADLVERTLMALCRQTVPLNGFEVIVVDDGCPVALAQRLASFDSGLSLRLVRIERQGPAAARNAGAAGYSCSWKMTVCRIQAGWGLTSPLFSKHRTPRPWARCATACRGMSTRKRTTWCSGISTSSTCRIPDSRRARPGCRSFRRRISQYLGTRSKHSAGLNRFSV